MTLEIFSLKQKPDFAPVCAAWSYGEWGCYDPNRRLDIVIEEYKTKASADSVFPKAWIGLAEGKIAGMISLDEEDHPDHTDLTPWVASFFIHPHFRGRGYSSSFLNRAEEEAKTLRHKTIYLHTSKHENLYSKYGWTTLGSIRHPCDSKSKVVLMKKDL